MPVRYYNPFQSIDINVPDEFHPTFTQYSQRSASPIIDLMPFRRMIDLWFLSVCVAARLGLDQVDISKYKTTKIVEGSIFASDPWRIHVLMLIAIERAGHTQIVSEPSKVIGIASGLAAAGLPRVTEMLKDGDGDPIWNLSDAIDNLLRSS